MTTRTIVLTVTAAALALAPFAALAADASVNASANVRLRAGAEASTSVRANLSGDRMTQAKERGDQEISRRITNLNKLAGRITDRKRLSESDQTTLSASIQSQISTLTALKAQIDADDSTTTLKADIGSITKSYRIYALIMPQAAITAAADRALNVAGLMEQFSTKLAARIASSSDASLGATLDDYNAKVADAKVEAQAAISGVAGLAPDNGDQSIQQSNLAALKAARAKVQAAQQDLVAARKDAGTLVKALGGGEASMHASANASTSAASH